jgi:RHS repeat-associated protein
MPTDEAHSFTAYGYAATLPSDFTILGFNGEPRQDVGNFYILGSGKRTYSHNLMRFLSTDNLSPFSQGGINSYSYCAGDPINRVDRNGHFFKWIHNITSSHPKYATVSKLIKAGDASRYIATHYEGDSFIRQSLEYYGYDKQSVKNLKIIEKALRNISKEADSKWSTPEAITQHIASFKYIAEHQSLVKNAYIYSDKSNRTKYSLALTQKALTSHMEDYQRKSDLKILTGQMEIAQGIRRQSL